MDQRQGFIRPISENRFDYPSTRYQGSKSKLLKWIWDNIHDIEFNRCLDAFGGTGAVGYFLKRQGKSVDYNDNLQFNYTIGKAIIENDAVTLQDHDIDYILTRQPNLHYPDFIQNTFRDIFFLDEENKWLDFVITNIHSLDNDYKKALAFTVLFQACIIKRPYNLFHRANLYMRTAEVKRSFGNKKTWDKPFSEYIWRFAQEFNRLIFANGQRNKAFCTDVFNMAPNYDLVYIDTPYMNAQGTGVDYLDFYHFLEGMLDYGNWHNRLALSYKHKRLKGDKSAWCQKAKIYDAFDRLFAHFKYSTLIVSYRSDGMPSEEELVEIMSKYKNEVMVKHTDYQYALSRQRKGQEILIIGK